MGETHLRPTGRLPATTGLFLLVLSALSAWAVCAAAWGPGGLRAALPYAAACAFLAPGAATGRRLQGPTARLVLPVVLALAAAVVLLAVPFYANAQAAWGLQLLALAALLGARLLGPLPGPGRRRLRWAGPALLAVAAAALIARAQAFSLLVIPFVLIILCVLFQAPRLSRRVIAAASAETILAAAAAVLALTTWDRWPEALSASGGLSDVRHRLWADALQLWRGHPVLGAGPGSFVEHSALAASTASLHRAHSSVLQIAVELGAVGVVLFLGVLVIGAAMALQGSRQAGIIAVAAWTVLAVHAMIDHLYEFPIVTLTAGVVLGWASATDPIEDDRPI